MEENRDQIINREAIFSAGTEDYRSPAEPDPGDLVILRFRTAKDDAEAVYCVVDGIDFPMQKSRTDRLFDYYEYEIQVGTDKIRYHFKAVKGEDICMYNRLACDGEDQPWFDFAIIPGFHTPDWSKGAVMYQIFTDRFCNGDKSNDVETGEYIYIGSRVQKVEDWDRNPSAMDVGYFYGGDLKGIWDKLDYIQSLGIEVIYLNPIFVSPSNHKYDCQDYEHVDPHYGVIVKDGEGLTAEEDRDNRNASKYVTRTTDPENLEASDRFFAQFVQEVHRRGMRLILDGVFNHCGSFNKWLDGERIYENQEGYQPGAYICKDSPYHSFFQFHDNRDEAWPYNRTYDGWWGHDTLPKLNYEDSQKLVDYIMNIARRWISPPFCVDGWRLDVAADLGHTAEYNHEFWRQFRKAVKEVNPDVLILAEHYGDPSPWLGGDQWDSVMNYDAFMEPVTWFLTGMEKHSDSFEPRLLGDGKSFFSSMNYHMSRMQPSSILTAMNELSNHDHSRFLTRTNHVVGRIGYKGAKAAGEDVKVCVLRSAVMIQMTWPGAPTVYYGDEAGLCGWTDPDNRRTYPWGREDLELIEYHRYMIGFHKHLPVLRYGSVKKLMAEKDLIAYGRMFYEYQAVVVVSNSAQEMSLELPVWPLGITEDSDLTRVMLTCEISYNVGRINYPVKNGILSLVLPPYGAALFVSHGDEFFPVVARVDEPEQH